MDLIEQKKQLRERLMQKRDGLSGRDVKSKSVVRQLSLIPRYTCADCVFCYVSFGSEVETHSLITDLLSSHTRVVVPKVIKGEMILCEITSFNVLGRSDFGILEPKEGAYDVVSSSDIDVCLVPGLGFDPKGRRLGYGGGYYDRFLSDFSGLSIGICFESQVASQIPFGEDDAVVDMVVTEKRIYRK